MREIKTGSVSMFVRDINNPREQANLDREDMRESILACGMVYEPITVFPEKFNLEGKMIIAGGNSRHFNVEYLINQKKLPDNFPIPYFFLDDAIASDKKEIIKYRLTTGTSSRQYTTREQANIFIEWLNEYWNDYLIENKIEYDTLPDNEKLLAKKLRSSDQYYHLLKNDDERTVRQNKIKKKAKKKISNELGLSQQHIDNLLSAIEIIDNNDIVKKMLEEEDSLTVRGVNFGKRMADKFNVPIEKVLAIGDKVRNRHGSKRISDKIFEIIEDILNLPDELVAMIESDVISPDLAATLIDNSNAMEIVARAIDLSPERIVSVFNLGIAEEQIKSEQKILTDNGSGEVLNEEEVKPKIEIKKKYEKSDIVLNEEEKNDIKNKIESSSLNLYNCIKRGYTHTGRNAHIIDSKLLEISKLCYRIEQLIENVS